ncbi:hypothetical protein Q0F99_01110 [Rathayibacter oskolensis]|uniref:hypothetical protein n=1 Tax=Rathayibacter oskolensis TaxID=1891671 RepID=UPI00265D6115|nr:hypothetical protein [Rathayibacter oskolensis]WKK71813.1 hypothetical protein Q0F99_01110 [Rathayibacter oskolensis]
MIRRAAPAAPRALAVAVLTVMVGGQALRNLLGWWGWGSSSRRSSSLSPSW